MAKAKENAAAGPRGQSLHIGLNFVDPAHYAGWDGELNACEFDAEDMEALAKQAGFATSNLIRGAATRAAVVAAIGNAAAVLKGGDIFLITYSGHGGSIPDPSGDEPDGKDETWCLYDGELIDDELGELWTKFAAGVRVLLISDSCHSGTIYKTQGASKLVLTADEVSEDWRATPRAMPLSIAGRTYRQNREFYDELQRGLAERGARDVAAQIACTVRLISGCMDNQYSYDGVANGLFTEELLRIWANGHFSGDYALFYQRILAKMPNEQSPQHNVIGVPNGGYDAQKPFAIA
ncbi:hypothetical protein ACFB49_34260 [Sphingomonas sp. DBB INV C78]|uniref:caspase family protein n=1 Tax=Sphingomonas sp. DBB INV C78 TaxID=3349434 RepID=UPI0036D3131B